MSETNLNPGGAHAFTGDGADAPAGRNRKLLLFGALALLVLLVAGYYFLSSGSAAAPSAGGPARLPVAVVPNAAPSAAPTLEAIPASYNAAVGRDPFAPLYVVPVAAPSPSATPSSTSTSSSVLSPAAPAPAAPVATGTSGATSGSTTTATSTTPGLTPSWIEFDSQVGERYANFTVAYTNGQLVDFQNVAAPAANSATIFGGQFALLGLTNGVAEVQEGDGQPFAIQQGTANRHSF
jgi:hypothetical protein